MKTLSVILAVPCLAAVAHADPLPTHKGFVEGGLGWGYAMSNVQFIEVNNGTLLAPPHASGFEFDLGGGLQLLPGLSLIGDLQRASATSIQGSGNNGSTEQISSAYTSLIVGVRTAVAAGPGELYADFGVGLAFPFDVQTDGTGGGGGGGGNTQHLTVGFNSGFGARGELGYHYTINEHLYVGGGLRLEAFSTDNVGRTRTRVDNNGQTTVETFTTDPNAQGPTPSALSVQDLRLRVSVGYRF